ncbi:GGDEF domain-containing protein [Paenibacillus sp. CC-CFT747]|nr:GGDEF domain-containing protein [Paenibacillus sp. CC-CFT747]
MAGNGGKYTYAIIRDISKRKSQENELAYLAHNDPLTGLPNRLSFVKELESRLEQSRLNSGFVALLVVDLDRFKRINDTVGHPRGDEALMESARRLEACLDANGMLARLGGDEFGILLSGLEEYDDVVKAAELVIYQFVEPFSLKGREFFSRRASESACSRLMESPAPSC